MATDWAGDGERGKQSPGPSGCPLVLATILFVIVATFLWAV